MKDNVKENLIVALILSPVFIFIAIVTVPAIKLAIQTDKTCTAIPKGWGEYDFVPNYFMDGEENIHLNKLKNDLCNRYFKNPSRDWYRGGMDGSMIQIKLCDNMYENEYSYLNGHDCGDGKYISINKQIIAYFTYNTKDVLEKGGHREITSVVLHELIHSYVSFYYPNSMYSNVNHKGIFAEIEKDLISQGCYLNQNYFRTDRERKKARKQYVASKNKTNN